MQRKLKALRATIIIQTAVCRKERKNVMKNNRYIKVICAILMLSMLFGMMSACKKKQDDTTGAADSQTETPTEEITEEVKYEHAVDVLGERDLTDETITFFARAGGNMWDIKSLYAEDFLSETINDAVYERNMRLQDVYGFDIQIVESGATHYASRVTEQILTGNYGFDVLTACAYDMAEMAASAVLRDLTLVDELEIDGNWWNNTLNDQLTVANSLYYLSGDIICEDNMAVRVVFFNKTMAESMNVNPTDLYNMAKEYKWTFEEMFELASSAYLDMDDVSGKSDGDRLGFIGQVQVAGYVFMTAAGVGITTKNDADEPVMNSKFDYDVLDSISAYFNRDESVLIQSDALTPYKHSRVLFMTEVLGSVTKIRDWDIKSGILPLPMYNETQQQYHHFVDGNCLNLLALPTGNNQRLEKVCFMMDAMCIESEADLNPAFYDTCLRGRYSYDPESSDMLDIILDSYFIENANIYKRAWGNMQDDIMEAIATGGSVSSIIASYSESLPSLISETVTKLKDISLAQNR